MKVDVSAEKKVLIIAGPNGAGKTTFARTFLIPHANLDRFINADLIAAKISPSAPESAAIQAGRQMLEEIEHCTRLGESFAFETTLAGLGYLKHIARWREKGYRVGLLFLRLPDADSALARVAVRVRQGGHNIPEDVVRRRFASGLVNFEQHYKSAVHDWALFDNSGKSPVLLEYGEKP